MKPQLNRVNALARKHIVDDHGDTDADDPDNNSFLIYQTSNNKWVDKTLENFGEYSTGTQSLRFNCLAWNDQHIDATIRWYKNANQISILLPDLILANNPIVTLDLIQSVAIPTDWIPKKFEVMSVGKGVNCGVDINTSIGIGKTIRIWNTTIGGNFSSGSGFSGCRSTHLSWIVANTNVLPSDTEPPIGADTVFADVSYNNENSLMRVNSAKNNLEEINAQITIPAANQLQLTSGTSDILFKSDTTIDQNLGKTANVQFATVNCGKLTVGGLIDPTGLELTPVDANPGTIPQNTLWLDSDNSNILKKNSNPIILGPTSSTDNALIKFDGTTGGLIKNTGIILDNSNNLSGLTSFAIGITPIISSISVDSSFSSENDTSLCTTKAIKSFVNNKIGGNIGVGIDNYIARYDGNNGIQKSMSIIVDDSDNITNINNLSTNTITCNVITELTENNGCFMSGNLLKNGGISLEPQASNPLSTANTDLWAFTGNILRCGTNNIVQASTSSVTDLTIALFDNTTGNKIKSSNMVIVDQDDMADNSNVKLCTQQSIKAYVDGKFSSGNASVTFSGPCVNTDITIYYSIVNNFVNLYIPSFSANGNSSASPMQSTAIPSVIRPASEQSAYIYALDSNHQSGYCLIRNSGVITIYRLQLSGSNIVYSNFSNSNALNAFGIVHATTITYKL
ncbi:MAG: hypothetical protein WC554_01980 [Clostridia bacterium]